MFKKLVIVGALAALVAPASFAQSTAISGSVSVGVLATGASGSAGDPNVTTLGGGANAINITATENLGKGLTAGVDSQIRFNAATGDSNSAGVGNALFHTANVYLTSNLGTVRLGRIGEASNCGFDPWGCRGGAALSAGTGVSALIAGGSTANAVQFATPKVLGLGASYQTSLSTRNNERRVVSLDYEQGPLALQVLRSMNSPNTVVDGAVGAAETIASITDEKGLGRSIGASYNLGVAKLNVVNAVTENAAGAKTANVYSVGASAPMGPYTLLAGYNKSKTGGAYTATAANDTKFSVGMDYALSKRTTLGADVFKAEVAGGSTGYAVRARHTF